MNVNERKNVGCFSTTFRDYLLDSSLIVATNNTELYNIKLIDCGNYIQIYSLDTPKGIKQNSEKRKNILNINTDTLKKVNHNSKKNNNIELKNITRSKLECQRLAKANCNDWETFITLTFEENITDIDYANKRLKYFIDKIRRVFPNFKYIGVPEFQDRGASHYHLLTNININNKNLIFEQEDKKRYKHIKYWNEGFTKVDSLKNDIKKIIGYISKYMTKDADIRLFNRHRYFYSRNLIKPKTNYLNLNNPNHLEFLNNKLNNKQLIYNNVYKNSYNDELINFFEYNSI